MESNTTNSSEISSQKRQDKNTKYETQCRTVSSFLYKNIASRYMTAIYTGVPIQNVCRYIDLLKKQNSICIVRIDKCQISGEMVEFLSTNPDNFPKCNQLKLF